MFRRQIISKESVSPRKGTKSNPYLTLLLLTFLFFLLFFYSLLPHRQYWGDSGGAGVRRHPRLHHSFHQEGSDHRAALRVPAGLPGLPDRRTLLFVCHSVVSLPDQYHQKDHYDQFNMLPLLSTKQEVPQGIMSEFPCSTSKVQ